MAAATAGTYRKPLWALHITLIAVSHFSLSPLPLPLPSPHTAPTMFRMGLLSVVRRYLTWIVPFAGYEWSRSSPLRSSPDTASSLYPDRPIRPMPRRSLRARLSPEQADTIVFPHHPPSTGPLFNFPYAATERGTRSLRTGENDHHACHCGHTHSEPESDSDDDERHGPLPSSPSYPYRRELAPSRAVAGAGGGHHKAGSTVSSVDGYESFENTNNKKKRKIPNIGSGSGSAHHAGLAADGAGLGVAHTLESSAGDAGALPGRYYGSAPATPQHTSTSTGTGTGTGTSTSAGTGISGAGRGRFGRSASGRSERRVLGASMGLATARASSKRKVPPRDLARLFSHGASVR